MSTHNNDNGDNHAEEPRGYGKPPKHSHFQKGKSGNPKGRPVGKKNFVSYLSEMLDSKVSVTENGKTHKRTSVEVSLARLREKALKGDQRALEKLLDYAEQYSAEQTAKDEEKLLSQADQAIFEEYEARIRLEAEQALRMTPDTSDMAETHDSGDSPYPVINKPETES